MHDMFVTEGPVEILGMLSRKDVTVEACQRALWRRHQANLEGQPDIESNGTAPQSVTEVDLRAPMPRTSSQAA